MIRQSMTPARQERVRALLDTGQPGPGVREFARQEIGEYLVPPSQALDLIRWLGRCHAYYGLGFPTVMVEWHGRLMESWAAIEKHPGLSGHGMLGAQPGLMMAVWAHPQGPKPYSLQPSPYEGFLVPTVFRIGVERCTSWTFELMPHGAIRPVSTMFRSEFAARGHSEAIEAAEAQDAAEERLRAHVLEGAEAPLEEDGGHVP